MYSVPMAWEVFVGGWVVGVWEGRVAQDATADPFCSLFIFLIFLKACGCFGGC